MYTFFEEYFKQKIFEREKTEFRKCLRGRKKTKSKHMYPTGIELTNFKSFVRKPR